MLTPEELENIAKLKRLSLMNAEKDYLQDLILFVLYSNMGKELIFKGGTCLYKIYKINRFSEDLDFTLTKKINLKKITNKVISDLIFLNIKSKIKEIDEYRNGINIKFLINGPLYRGSRENQCFIPLNISLREQPLLEPIKESIISIYKEIPNFEVFVMNEKEILTEKIRALLTRDKARDVYDVWFLLNKEIKFDINGINRKLKLYKKKFNMNEFIEKIEEKRKDWKTDLKYLIIGDLPEFDLIKEEIIKKIVS